MSASYSATESSNTLPTAATENASTWYDEDQSQPWRKLVLAIAWGVLFMYIKIRDLAVQPFPGQVLPVSTGPVAAGSGVRARISQVMTSLKYYFHVQFISLFQTVSAACSQVRSNPINSAVGALAILVFGGVLAAVVWAEKYKFPFMFGDGEGGMLSDGEGGINYPATADW